MDSMRTMIAPSAPDPSAASLTCVPAVEFFAGAYSERAAPTSPHESYGDWESACLRDAGLGDLPRVGGCSWLVPVRALEADGVVRRIVAHALEECAPGDGLDLDEVAALSGGIVLSWNDEPILRPGCCCDLATMIEWQRVIAEPPEAWYAPWCGHDQQSMEVRGVSGGAAVELRVGPWMSGTFDRTVTFPREAVQRTFAAAAADLMAFAMRIERNLSVEVPTRSRGALARRLAGLDGGDDP